MTKKNSPEAEAPRHPATTNSGIINNIEGEMSSGKDPFDRIMKDGDVLFERIASAIEIQSETISALVYIIRSLVSAWHDISTHDGNIEICQDTVCRIAREKIQRAELAVAASSELQTALQAQEAEDA